MSWAGPAVAGACRVGLGVKYSSLFFFIFISLCVFFYYESNTVVKIQRVQSEIKRKLKEPPHSAHTNPLPRNSCSDQCHVKPSRYSLACTNRNIRVYLWKISFLRKKEICALKKKQMLQKIRKKEKANVTRNPSPTDNKF